MSAYGKAKTMDSGTLTRIIDHVASHPQFGSRNKVMVMLSFHAGMRAAEIAGITWDDLTDAEGKVRTGSFFIPAHIAKKNSSREVPLHPQLREALVEAHATRKGNAVAYMQTKPTQNMSANYVAIWFKQMYSSLGLQGCSSHSGRRTMITNMARLCNEKGCSLVDVQGIAGHSFIGTTEKYIEPSKNVGNLVAALYA